MDACPKRHAPHMVYTSLGTRDSKMQTRALHQHLSETGRVLKCFLSSSTPNLEWQLLLVPGRLPSAAPAACPEAPAGAAPRGCASAAPARAAASPADHGADSASSSPFARTASEPSQPRQVSHTGTPTPAPAQPPCDTGRAAPAGRPCFYAYFIPYNANLDKLGDRSLEASYWLSRRVRTHWSQPSSRCGEDADVTRWREERKMMRVDPLSGIPLGEQLVSFNGYWDQATSVVGTGGARPQEHTSRVRSVAQPDHHFHYSGLPLMWSSDQGVGRLVPVTEHEEVKFLEPCECNNNGDNCGGNSNGDNCGGIEAREALRALRTSGVQVELEVRKSLRGEGQERDALGVFTRQAIPRDTFVCEYVGVWRTLRQVQLRKLKCPEVAEYKTLQELYAAADLHYQYDMRHRTSDPERYEDSVMVVDATHVGNVARFVNHHCSEANLVARNVCQGALDVTHMTILFQTLRDMDPGEELLVDYHFGMDEETKARIRSQPVPAGATRCTCGAANCLKQLWPRLEGSQNRSTKAAPSKAGQGACAAVRGRQASSGDSLPRGGSGRSRGVGAGGVSVERPARGEEESSSPSSSSSSSEEEEEEEKEMEEEADDEEPERKASGVAPASSASPAAELGPATSGNLRRGAGALGEGQGSGTPAGLGTPGQGPGGVGRTPGRLKIKLPLAGRVPPARKSTADPARQAAGPGKGSGAGAAMGTEAASSAARAVGAGGAPPACVAPWHSPSLEAVRPGRGPAAAGPAPWEERRPAKRARGGSPGSEGGSSASGSADEGGGGGGGGLQQGGRGRAAGSCSSDGEGSEDGSSCSSDLDITHTGYVGGGGGGARGLQVLSRG